MGVPIGTPDDSYRVATMGMDNPATELTPLHWYSGMATSLPDSMTQGFSETVGALDKGLSQVVKGATWLGIHAPGSANAGASVSDFTQDPSTLPGMATQALQDSQAQMKELRGWSQQQMDPSKVAAIPQLVGSTARGLTIFGMGSLAGGPWVGASTLGLTEGSSTYQDDLDKGVDPGTALKHSLLAGSLSGAGAFLPMKVSGQASLELAGLGLQAEVAGNTTLSKALYGMAGTASKFVPTSLGAKLVSGAAINTGFGATSRYLSSSLLDGAGYHDMAAQYKVMDGQALASDMVLGLAFGGLGALEGHGQVKPDQATIETALGMRRNEMIARGAAGIPVDPQTAALDTRLQDAAMGNMVRGNPVEVSAQDAKAVMEGALIDPARTDLNEAYHEAGKKAFGQVVDFQEPELQDTTFEKRTQERAKQVFEDPATAEAYANMEGTRSGALLDVDSARKLDPGYLEDPGIVGGIHHQEVSDFIQRMFSARMAEAPKTDTESVRFLAGGGGSGKGTALKQLEMGQDHTILDSTFSSYGKAKRLVQEALDSGRRVGVDFVYRPVEKAVNGMVERAHTEGRTVPLEALAKAHKQSIETVQRLMKDYADDGRVKFRAVDNSGGIGEAKAVPQNETAKFLAAKTYGDDVVDKVQKAYADIKEQGYEKGNERFPVSAEVHQSATRPAMDRRGIGSENASPSRFPEQVAAGKIPGQPAPKVDPLTQEQVQQLATQHPDLEVQLPDGRTVPAAALPHEMGDALAKAQRDSGLYDVAISCFMRTML